MSTAVKTIIFIAMALSTNGTETTGRKKTICGNKTAIIKTASQSRESSNLKYAVWKNELYLSPLSKAILQEF